MKHVAPLSRTLPLEAEVHQSLYMTLLWQIPLQRILFILWLALPDKAPEWRQSDLL
jgi:hypothetical protein